MLVTDAQDVAKSLRDEQRRRRPLALDQGIGDDCRGVHDHPIHLAWHQTRPLEHGMNAGEETFDEVVRGGERLIHGQASGRVPEHDIGEGAADVHRQRIAQCCLHPSAREMRLAAPTTASICVRPGCGGMNWVAPTMAMDPTMHPEWSNTGAARALTPSITSPGAVAQPRRRTFATSWSSADRPDCGRAKACSSAVSEEKASHTFPCELASSARRVPGRVPNSITVWPWIRSSTTSASCTTRQMVAAWR